MTCQEYNNTGESKITQHDLSTYYQLIKRFDHLLDSLYRDQVINFMSAHFEKHLTEELMQELTDSLIRR